MLSASELPLRLKAANGEVVAVGEGDKTRSTALSSIDSVTKNAPDAHVDDQTT